MKAFWVPASAQTEVVIGTGFRSDLSVTIVRPNGDKLIVEELPQMTPTSFQLNAAFNVAGPYVITVSNTTATAMSVVVQAR